MADEAQEGPAPQAQRRWQAACPHCGAPVEFASAASASAVCGYCRSTLLREGQALRRIGESAELFDDHSPLQLGASGQDQGQPFTLVGRLQYRYEGGVWNEWHALFDRADGPPRTAWLSEDNGAYVLSFEQPAPQVVPDVADLQPGLRRQVGLAMWSVASVQRVTLGAAQGELPRPPPAGAGEFVVADLRNPAGEVGTLDFSDPAAPQWAVGRSVTLAALKMQGLRDGAAEQALAGRSLACPQCGAALQPTLATTQSLSCGQCHAVVDISQGEGADLAHYAQNNSGADGVGAGLPLGRTGRLDVDGSGQPQSWQLVGLMERCDLPGAGDEGDEQTFWREYLIYHRSLGFAFLVDADDGWSVVRPLTGAPDHRGTTVHWSGMTFRPRGAPYRAMVTWVQGEFYWRVQRDETAQVTDHEGPRGTVLSREQTRDEVTWSVGRRISADAVAQAFRLTPAERARMRRDASPLAGLSGLGGGGGSVDWLQMAVRVTIGLVLLVILIGLLARCDGGRDDCAASRDTFGAQSAEYQQCLASQRRGGSSGGGSFGGFSSGGGGHK